MQPALGQKLIIHASLTQREAVLIAPFVKVDVLRRILNCLPKHVPLTLVSRWIPAEIIAGVCDLEIFDLISQRGNARFFVNELLHAKSYRFDDNILIGSANLTGKALGWASPANLEILVPAGEQAPSIRDFEKQLTNCSTIVDASFRDRLAEELKQLDNQPLSSGSCYEAHLPTSTTCWLPSCRDPRRLWMVYSNPVHVRNRIVETAYKAAISDLQYLSLPGGLTEDKFRELVILSLNSLPLVSEIKSRAKMGISDDEANELIEGTCGLIRNDSGDKNGWEILREWLFEFFPNVYRQESYPNVFTISRVL